MKQNRLNADWQGAFPNFRRVGVYFDSIPHDRLMALVAGSISDGRVLSLIEGFLQQNS